MSNPDDLSDEARFALDPVTNTGGSFEMRHRARGWGKQTIRSLKEEFIGDDPIRRWLIRHSAAFYAIVDMAAIAALRDGKKAIDPEEVASRMEEMRRQQDASWGSFDTGRSEG